jgi:SnoaL-like domain
MEPSEVVAREEIRELVAQYTHFGDSGKLAELSLLFHPDATFHIVGQEVDLGREAIIARLGGLQDQIEHDAVSQYVRHHISNLHITFADATEAHGVAYWQVINGDGLVRWGRYRDAFRRIGEGPWKFSSRQVRRDPPSLQE